MKRYCNILRDGRCSKRTLKRLQEQLISQERNAASNHTTHCNDIRFISCSTSTILSCSEVEETHDSFQNPESFVAVFDSTGDSDQVEHVYEETLP